METEQLIQLIQTVSSSKLTEFHYEENDMKLVLKKEEQLHIAKTSNLELHPAIHETEEEMENADISENVVKSPLVGTFYSAPAEDAAPFVQVGESVKKGQTIAIVEAMKLMNEIECEFDGIVTDIYVKNGQTVEYGQPLFCIK